MGHLIVAADGLHNLIGGLIAQQLRATPMR
jgi:hypothetical protein